ncbi:ATP-binding protein [Arenimonas sp. GDDSR-1]|uniref:ATP-binding protein n=1 Tax=Arenimonas sp. GDDSR-1 TaxID=2950125 RepID=UPI00260CF481|nr:ATP-binding protein [Arenimonas sp. GDDSR-1]
MNDQDERPQQSTLIRWLALASAAGAAISSGISLWLNDSVWLNVSVISSLLTVSFVAALWHRIESHHSRIAQTEINTEQHLQEVTGLRTELEKQRSLEFELKKSKLAAEAAAMAKSEFLATMSHEIRTPLNGIIPMLDLLSTTPLEKDQSDILSTARSSAGQMKRIVDDILDYSKLEANKLQLETTGMNLRDVVNSVVRMFQNQADAKHLAIQVHLDPSLRLAVRGDPVRLRQVLSNLLSNAIKFTDKGTLTLSVKAKSETRQHHILRFEVKDTGIGISPENAGSLFKPFSQADASTTRLYGGTGLGLVICKRIIDLMAGQIGVDSQPGAGSTFWFEIPMLKAVGDSHGLATELKNANVLLFSSDPILTGKIEKANINAGAQLNVAGTVFEAQRILKESVAVGSTSDLDLLVIDVSSGRQSALQLQKSLLADSEFARLRIAMLQSVEGPALELDKTPRRRVIARNTDMSTLFAELNRLLASTASELQPPGPHEQKPAVNILPADLLFVPGQSRGLVLLVEDNPVNLLVAQRLIQICNFDCLSAENGEIAIDMLQQNPDFDLVLMDCQMPVMDGYRATQTWRRIEAEKSLPRLPIIAMTANAMAEDRQRCLDAGMDDYLSKPVDRKLLEQVMMKWMTRHSEAPPVESKAPAPAAPEAAPPAAAAQSPALDMEIVEDLQEMMGSDYQSLIRIYLEDSPKLIGQIQSALDNRDCTALVAPAHTLKSSSANLGAMALSDIAKTIEKSARSGDIDTPLQAGAGIAAEFERVRAALAAIIA